MNYLLAFLMCVSLTVMAALGDAKHLRYLIISDINVAIWLLVAWFLGK